jgi:hypothetical protein
VPAGIRAADGEDGVDTADSKLIIAQPLTVPGYSSIPCYSKKLSNLQCRPVFVPQMAKMVLILLTVN